MTVPKEGNNGVGRVENDGKQQCLQLLWTGHALDLDSVLVLCLQKLETHGPIYGKRRNMGIEWKSQESIATTIYLQFP